MPGVAGRIVRVTVVAAVVAAGACSNDTASESESEPEPTLAAPDATYADLAARLDLTSEGEQLLFAMPIEFGGLTDALDQCQAREPLPVMGCVGDDGAFVIDVDEERFAGMRELAVAHLLLHEAWDGLSPDERADLGPLVQAAASDPGVALYVAAAEGRGLDRPTEQFAVAGSQIAELDPALSEVYGRWFADRDIVVFTAATATSALRGAEADLMALAGRLDAERPGLEARDDLMDTCTVDPDRSAAGVAALPAGQAGLQRRRHGAQRAANRSAQPVPGDRGPRPPDAADLHRSRPARWLNALSGR